MPSAQVHPKRNIKTPSVNGADSAASQASYYSSSSLGYNIDVPFSLSGRKSVSSSEFFSAFSKAVYGIENSRKSSISVRTYLLITILYFLQMIIFPYLDSRLSWSGALHLSGLSLDNMSTRTSSLLSVPMFCFIILMCYCLISEIDSYRSLKAGTSALKALFNFFLKWFPLVLPFFCYNMFFSLPVDDMSIFMILFLLLTVLFLGLLLGLALCTAIFFQEKIPGKDIQVETSGLQFLAFHYVLSLFITACLTTFLLEYHIGMWGMITFILQGVQVWVILKFLPFYKSWVNALFCTFIAFGALLSLGTTIIFYSPDLEDNSLFGIIYCVLGFLLIGCISFAAIKFRTVKVSRGRRQLIKSGVQCLEYVHDYEMILLDLYEKNDKDKDLDADTRRLIRGIFSQGIEDLTHSCRLRVAYSLYLMEFETHREWFFASKLLQSCITLTNRPDMLVLVSCLSSLTNQMKADVSLGTEISLNRNTIKNDAKHRLYEMDLENLRSLHVSLCNHVIKFWRILANASIDSVNVDEILGLVGNIYKLEKRTESLFLHIRRTNPTQFEPLRVYASICEEVFLEKSLAFRLRSVSDSMEEMLCKKRTNAIENRNGDPSKAAKKAANSVATGNQPSVSFGISQNSELGDNIESATNDIDDQGGYNRWDAGSAFGGDESVMSSVSTTSAFESTRRALDDAGSDGTSRMKFAILLSILIVAGGITTAYTSARVISERILNGYLDDFIVFDTLLSDISHVPSLLYGFLDEHMEGEEHEDEEDHHDHFFYKLNVLETRIRENIRILNFDYIEGSLELQLRGFDSDFSVSSILKADAVVLLSSYVTKLIDSVNTFCTNSEGDIAFENCSALRGDLVYFLADNCIIVSGELSEYLVVFADHVRANFASLNIMIYALASVIIGSFLLIIKYLFFAGLKLIVLDREKALKLMCEIPKSSIINICDSFSIALERARSGLSDSADGDSIDRSTMNMYASREKGMKGTKSSIEKLSRRFKLMLLFPTVLFIIGASWMVAFSFSNNISAEVLDLSGQRNFVVSEILDHSMIILVHTEDHFFHNDGSIDKLNASLSILEDSVVRFYSHNQRLHQIQYYNDMEDYYYRWYEADCSNDGTGMSCHGIDGAISTFMLDVYRIQRYAYNLLNSIFQEEEEDDHDGHLHHLREMEDILSEMKFLYMIIYLNGFLKTQFLVIKPFVCEEILRFSLLGFFIQYFLISCIIGYIYNITYLQVVMNENKRVYQFLLMVPENVLGSIQSVRQFLSKRDLEEYGVVSNETYQTESILQGCEDAVVVFDDSNLISIFNPSAERVLGYSVDQILGTSVGVLLPEVFAFVKKRKKKMKKITDEIDKTDTRQMRVRHKSGVSIDVLVSVSSFINAGVTTHAVFLRDIRDMIKKEQELLSAKKKVDALVLNIFPKKIAETLKKRDGSRRVVAKRFESVTIMFADIVGFTEMSSKMDPDALVLLLNEVFSNFDILCDEYSIEKIKTIGDCFMCVCGLPDRIPDHAFKAVSYAFAIMNSVAACNKVFKAEDPSFPSLSIRIGLHTGPVVAGVIGLKKTTYDIWGDSVNIASRIESTSNPSSVHISVETYKELEALDKLGMFKFKSQNVELKGKGKYDTYLCSLKKEYLPVDVKRSSSLFFNELSESRISSEQLDLFARINDSSSDEKSKVRKRTRRGKTSSS